MQASTKFGARLDRKRQSGQAMVEFMLVVIFVFLLFVAAMQMILLLYAYNTLADAAKEGVRYAIVHGTQNTVCSGPGDPITNLNTPCPDPNGDNVAGVVANFAGLSFQSVAATNNQCSPSLGSNISEVDVCYDPNSINSNSSFKAQCSAPGCLVRVQVIHTYRPFFGLGWPSVKLSAAADGWIMN